MQKKCRKLRLIRYSVQQAPRDALLLNPFDPCYPRALIKAYQTIAGSPSRIVYPGHGRGRDVPLRFLI